MAKRKVDAALHPLSPNETFRGTARKSSRTTPGRWTDGKENGHTYGGSNTPSKPSKSSTSLPGGSLSWKRSRLGADLESKTVIPEKRNRNLPKENSQVKNGWTQLVGRSCDGQRDLLGSSLEGTKNLAKLLATSLQQAENGPSEHECRLTYRRRGKSYTSKEGSPSGSVLEEKASPTLDSSIKQVERLHGTTEERNGSSEKQVERRSNEDVTPVTATGSADVVKSSQEADDRAQSSGNNLRSSDEHAAVGPSPAGLHPSSIEEPVTTTAQVTIEDDSRKNTRNFDAGGKTVRVVPDKKSSEGPDRRERADGVASNHAEQNLGTTEGICSACRGAGLHSKDDGAATQVLGEAYNKLYNKYQRSKTKNMAKVDALYDEQLRRFAAFSTAADALVGRLREDNSYLIRQLQETGLQEIVERSRLLKEEYIECKNDLVMERSKVLELEQELREAHTNILKLRTICESTRPMCNSNANPSAQLLHLPEVFHGMNLITESTTKPHSKGGCTPEDRDEIKNAVLAPDMEIGNDGPRTEVAVVDEQKQMDVHQLQSISGALETEPEAKGHKLLKELLQSLTQMTAIVDREMPHIVFTHEGTGFSFKLEQNKLSQEVGGDDAILYQVIVPGTLLHLAPEWMRSEIVFDIVQAQVFVQRILTVALGS